MMEYRRHIDEYLNYSHSSFSKLISSNEWGNKILAEEFLTKYWLSEQEYIEFWKPIQDKIFVQGKNFPDLIYQSKFEIIALKGGSLFTEEDFKQLQKAMMKVGEEYFVIIQHSQEFKEGEPMFRMKFPVDITWEELTSGNYISAVLLEMSYNEYFVFGKNENWGKYSANDYDFPLDIIGFKHELASIFKEYFMNPKEIIEEVLPWLPQEYKELIK